MPTTNCCYIFKTPTYWLPEPVVAKFFEPSDVRQLLTIYTLKMAKLLPFVHSRYFTFGILKLSRHKRLLDNKFFLHNFIILSHDVYLEFDKHCIKIFKIGFFGMFVVFGVILGHYGVVSVIPNEVKNLYKYISHETWFM